MRRIWQAIRDRRRFESDLAEELRFHLEARAADIERTGLSHQEALRLARLEMGALEHYREECRRARGLRWLDELRQDLLYAFRGLAHNRAFAAVAIATLTLGIGANAGIFALVNSVLLKTLPVEAPGQLHAVYWTLPLERPAFSRSTSGTAIPDGALRVADMFAWPHFLRLREDLSPAADLFAHAGAGRLHVTIDDRAQLARGLAASWNYFRALGVKAYLGRTFLPEDEDAASSAPAALLSHHYWSATFAGDPAILGRTLKIGDARLVVAGILPPGFHGVNPGESFDVALPLPVWGRMTRGPDFGDSRTWWVQMMARIGPDAQPGQVRSEVETRLIAAMRSEQVREPWDPPRIRLVNSARGLHWLRWQFEKPLRLVMSVALLILLMAAVNVAGLLLARSDARVSETGARLALGASRMRLLRQHLTESLLLALLGLSGGLALAGVLGGVLPSLLARQGEPPVIDLTPDLRFTAICVLATFAIAFVFGVYPAWKSSGLPLTAALKRVQGARSGRLPLGRVLVGAQVGLSLVLLISAAMFLRTVANLRSLKLGFQPEGLLVFSADASRAGYKDERLIGFYEDALQRLAEAPGIRSVSLSRHGLLQGGASQTRFYFRSPEGQVQPLGGSHIHDVAPGYFHTVGVPVLMGRDIRSNDLRSTRRVVLVNERLARLLRPDGGSPIGLTLYEDEKGEVPAEIVGVVGDAKYDLIRRDVPATVYSPFGRRSVRGGTFFVKTQGDPRAIAATVRRVMADVDPLVAIHDLRTQEEQISLAMERERILARLLSGFGSLALVLAAVGIYGVLSYSVARRTSEIGIRLALGAAPGAVQRMIVGESLLPVALGVGCGLLAASWFTRPLESFVFGVRPMEAWLVTGSVLALLAGAALAAWIPAHRASRLTPMSALRYE